MTKQTRLFFFFLLLSLLALIPAVSAQQPYLSAADLTKILANRTFAMTDLEQSGQSSSAYGGSGQNSHVYFAGDGKYTILFPSGLTRTTDNWQIDANDNLCLRRARRSADDTDYVTNCGRVSLAGPNALNLFDDKGKLTRTLQFLGNGNLLEQFAR
ncbi:MAG: hypothetical protein C4531_10950 [Desulfurivibrio sp.]|nr:MAG: hypothetical protein C4531_10950 [Desulfurivibrio sp.]